VEIDREWYKVLHAWFLDTAIRRSAEKVALDFYRFPFEPYAPVRRQMLNLLRAVNKARKQAGQEPIPVQAIPLHRRVVKPFEPSRILIGLDGGSNLPKGNAVVRAKQGGRGSARRAGRQNCSGR
jgi:hypothetical protein